MKGREQSETKLFVKTLDIRARLFWRHQLLLFLGQCSIVFLGRRGLAARKNERQPWFDLRGWLSFVRRACGRELLFSMSYRRTTLGFSGQILFQRGHRTRSFFLGIFGAGVGRFRFVRGKWVIRRRRFYLHGACAGGHADEVRAGRAGDVFSGVVNVTLDMLAAGRTVKFKIAHNSNDSLR